MEQGAVFLYKEGVNLRLPNVRMLEKWIRHVVKVEGRQLDTLTFIYCSDDYLRNINLKYLKINNITDVIAFGYDESTLISGDVFISVDRVRENASYYGASFHHELKRVMVHGLLHLLGYRDKEKADKVQMTEREDLYLSLHPR